MTRPWNAVGPMKEETMRPFQTTGPGWRSGKGLTAEFVRATPGSGQRLTSVDGRKHCPGTSC